MNGMREMTISEAAKSPEMIEEFQRILKIFRGMKDNANECGIISIGKFPSPPTEKFLEHQDGRLGVVG